MPLEALKMIILTSTCHCPHHHTRKGNCTMKGHVHTMRHNRHRQGTGITVFFKVAGHTCPPRQYHPDDHLYVLMEDIRWKYHIPIPYQSLWHGKKYTRGTQTFRQLTSDTEIYMEVNVKARGGKPNNKQKDQYPTPIHAIAEGHITFITDGSSLNNPGPAGAAVILCTNADPVPRRRYAMALNKASNNLAELHAVAIVLNDLLVHIDAQQYEEHKDRQQVHIYTDSQYVIGAMHNNKVNANTQIIEAMKSALNFVSKRFYIHFHHIRGHKGDPYNEHADYMAKKAVEMYTNGQEIHCIETPNLFPVMAEQMDKILINPTEQIDEPFKSIKPPKKQMSLDKYFNANTQPAQHEANQEQKQDDHDMVNREQQAQPQEERKDPNEPPQNRTKPPISHNTGLQHDSNMHGTVAMCQTCKQLEVPQGICTNCNKAICTVCNDIDSTNPTKEQPCILLCPFCKKQYCSNCINDIPPEQIPYIAQHACTNCRFLDVIKAKVKWTCTHDCTCGKSNFWTHKSTLIKHYRERYWLNPPDVTKRFIKAFGLQICATQMLSMKYDEDRVAHQQHIIDNCKVFTSMDTHNSTCLECQKNTANIHFDQHKTQASSINDYAALDLPTFDEIFKVQLPTIKSLPKSFSLDYAELNTKIIRLINRGHDTCNTQVIINGWKVWFMTNMIILRKKDRFGKRYGKLIKNIIVSITNGGLLREWDIVKNLHHNKNIGRSSANSKDEKHTLLCASYVAGSRSGTL